MKYFITGATGFLGSYLATLVRNKGHEVIALVRNLDNATELQKIGVQIAKGDITDKDSMRQPMQACDAVFHVAGWYKVGNVYQGQGDAINILGTKNVLELMMEYKIKKGVYTSTIAVNSDTKGVEVNEKYSFYGKHISHYDRTKAEAHFIANEFIKKGLPLVIVQPGLIYGKGDTSTLRENLIQFLEGKMPMFPSRTAYSWGHVEDIAMGHWLAMEKGKIGENYFICGPSHTAVEAFKMIATISGMKMPFIVHPFLLKVSSWFAKPFDKWLPTMYTSEYLRVMAGTTYIASAKKAINELGFNVRSLQEGLLPLVKYEIGLLKNMN